MVLSVKKRSWKSTIAMTILKLKGKDITEILTPLSTIQSWCSDILNEVGAESE